MKSERFRFCWIVERAVELRGLDTLNSEMVDDYAKATETTLVYRTYGANNCPQLVKDLRAMTKARYLDRKTIGISGLAGMGFPRWVWSYRVTSLGSMYAGMENVV